MSYHYTRKIPLDRGGHINVEVTIDLDKLAADLGRKALASKDTVSVLDGVILVDADEVPKP